MHILLSLCSKLNDNSIMLCGDFNLNLLNKTESKVVAYINMLRSFGLHQTIKHPTRLSKTSATLIDKIFVKSSVSFESGIIQTALSDHHGQQCSFKLPNKAKKKSALEHCRRKVSNRLETTYNE